MDIAFIGDEEVIGQELSRTEAELNMLMKNLEAEELSDIQPEDMPEAEILPDPAVYDTLRFVVKDLEAEGKIHCPCGKGRGNSCKTLNPTYKKHPRKKFRGCFHSVGCFPIGDHIRYKKEMYTLRFL
jgi:hypothetical protein